MNVLDEIWERTDKATPGPWEVFWYGGVRSRSTDKTVCHGPGPEGKSNLDAEFIAHAREDVPKLACVVEVIKSLHWRQFHTNRPSTCHADGKYWPCPTQQAIEVLG